MTASSKVVWLTAVGLAVLVAGGALLRRPSSPLHAEPAPPAVQADTEARAQLLALQRDLAWTRAEVNGLKQQAAAPAPVVESEPAATAPAALPKAVTVEAAQAHFQSIIEHETLDASWARTEEQSIGDFVRDEGGPGSTLESVTCRSTMCRLQVGFPNRSSREAFKQKLGLPPLNNGGFYREEADNKLVYYSAREGHPLPTVPRGP